MTKASAVRILVAEDEMLIRELAVEEFIDAGFEVIACGTGDEALAVLETDSDFALLFTDIRMPGQVDGIELARRAKASRPGLRVIYATGYDDRDLDLGPEERRIPKPYTMPELLGLLAELGLRST